MSAIDEAQRMRVIVREMIPPEVYASLLDRILSMSHNDEDGEYDEKKDALTLAHLGTWPFPKEWRIHQGNRMSVVDLNKVFEYRKKLRSYDSTSRTIRFGPMLERCPICLERRSEMLRKKKAAVVTACGHVYCKPCTSRLMFIPSRYTAIFDKLARCPTCRKLLTVTDLRQTEL